MVGQGHVVQALSNALTNKRLHHAYLFTGTRGVGKTTVSRILAKAVNCVGENGQGDITARPCGVCQPCRDIDAGRFVDYVELDAASNRGVEEISQLLEQAVYKPVVGRFKVYMIDEVHMLSNTAFNAMLKTLEEPPDYLKFVLATTDPQKVPVTVLSRCLQFNLRPMAVDTVREHLAQVLQQEQIAHEPDALRLLARAARGSMRDALSLTDQAIAFGAGALQEATVRQMLGTVDRVHVQRIVAALSARDAAAMVGNVEDLRQLGLSAAGTLEDLAVALQRMAVYQAVPATREPEDPDERLWFDLAGQLAPDETQLYYSLTLQARAELALAPDEYGGLTMALLRCLAFAPVKGGGAPPKASGLAEPSPVQARPALVSRPVERPVEQPAVRPVERPAAVVAPVAPAAVAAAVPAPQAVVRASASAPAPVAPKVAAASSDGPPPWADMDIPPGEPDAAPAAPMPQAEVREPPRRAAVAERAQAEPPVAAVATSVAVEPVRDEPEPPPPDDTELDRLWHSQVMSLSQQGLVVALVRELAMQAQCLEHEPLVAGGASPAVWVVRVERESLCTDANIERLRAALGTLVAGDAVLRIEKGRVKHTPATKEQAIREARQRAAQRMIEHDPLVRQLIAQFPGAQIVAGSVRPQ
ncbi:MAG: hypothetical protein RI907_1551 [Pseudomonadota bacterium]